MSVSGALLLLKPRSLVQERVRRVKKHNFSSRSLRAIVRVYPVSALRLLFREFLLWETECLTLSMR